MTKSIQAVPAFASALIDFAQGFPPFLYFLKIEGVSNILLDRMFNDLIEITFFNFPRLSKTFTSCINYSRFHLFGLGLMGKKKTTPKRSGE